ncbi:MAG: ATP-dependent helicase HrpB [Muribaculaceae bacterium]|nr:ATP-dependent helicase HrpB [Muribaculaceae bacterium]
MSILHKFNELPVSAIANRVCAALEEHPRLLVTAPPGAGKSTLLPLALIESIPEGKILMLEPRRIAARQVAARMATMLGEATGITVGYRVRFESKVSQATRIEVLTEGILERMLVEDPTLAGVSAVIFDEFHERSLTSDLTLALTREIQNLVRPDLKILVMSATIDAGALCRQMDARHLHSEGRMHEVEVIYGEDFDPGDCPEVVARAVRRALRERDGNILAFLPGQAEIMRCLELLLPCKEDVEILTLFGMMPHSEQQKALTPSCNGKRRVYLASPIAETSLTIEGVSTIVDSGLYRAPEFVPSTGLSRLTTKRISLDMATQRAGRAGRLSDGVCYRLWTKATESRMAESRQPEIESADLSGMMLSVAAWGETDAMRLPWISPPPAGHLANAANLLRILGAIDNSNHLTPKGQRLALLPCHPRIASMLTEAGPLKALAADIAALLEEKDPVNDESDADISNRIAMLRQYRRGKIPTRWLRIDNISSQYRRLVHAAPDQEDHSPEDIGELVAMAYPERIAMPDGSGHYRLASGGNRIALHTADNLARHEMLAVASMGKRIFLAAPVSREFVMSKGKWMESVIWDSREGKAVARDELRVGVLTLATRPAKGDVRGMIASAIAAAAPKEGLTMFDFNDDVMAMQVRISAMASWHPELDLPDISTEALLNTASEWLPLYIGNATTVQELRKINMCDVIFGMLDYGQQQEIDRLAPTHIKLPSGRNARIHYRRGAEAPVVSARLQDCFGLMQTPRIDAGKRPVLMELLSPGFKPVQLTQDMEGFWRETYFEVRKELRRRYPKHRWPDDPAAIS